MNDSKDPTPQLASKLVGNADKLLEGVVTFLLERDIKKSYGPGVALVHIAAAAAVYLRELAMAQSVLAQLEVMESDLGEDLGPPPSSGEDLDDEDPGPCYLDDADEPLERGGQDD